MPLPGQTVSGVDEQVVLETAPSVQGIVVLARPPFVDWSFWGAELHFVLEDTIEAVPFRSDPSGRISLSYRTSDRFNLIVQAVWLSGKGIAASEAVHLRRNPYAEWQNGPPHDPNVWPIGVWLQDPARATDYAAIGVNF